MKYLLTYIACGMQTKQVEVEADDRYDAESKVPEDGTVEKVQRLDLDKSKIGNYSY